MSEYDVEPLDEEGWPVENPRVDLDERVNALIAEMLESADLDKMAELEPLVEDVLFLNTVTRVFGPSGSLKSFLVLSLAGAVGGGAEWYGKEVRQGLVVYLVAEGAEGMGKRKRAWEQHHDRKMTGVKFLPRPVQTMSPEWAVLIEACRRLEPVLIIIDTQARVTVGVKENDNTEMGVVVDRMEQLRMATGACVLVVHHTGHEATERGRGASAVLGAMQTELGVTRTGKRLDSKVTLRTHKQKDDEEESDFVFGLHQIKLHGEFKKDGRPVTSVVLVLEKGDSSVPAEGTPEWIVAKLDKAGVPVGWGSPRVIKTCVDLGIKARKAKIEEAVKIRKNRTNQVPPNLPRDLESDPPPNGGGDDRVSADQTSPQRIGGRSGEASPNLPPPSPPLREGGGGAARGANGYFGQAICEVCFTVIDKITPDQTQHFPRCGEGAR